MSHISNRLCSPHSRYGLLSCFTHVWLAETPWTVACQAPLSVGFSRQEYWSGLSCPPPGALPSQESNQHLLCLLHRQSFSRSLPSVSVSFFLYLYIYTHTHTHTHIQSSVNFFAPGRFLCTDFFLSKDNKEAKGGEEM